MPVRRKFIREVVERLLDENAIKQAPVPAERIAKRLKIEVKFEEAEDDLSGFLFRDPTTKQAIIGVNASHHENRKRFTLAHELGHFILHEGQTVHIDENPKRLPFRINLRDEESAKGSDDDEKEANLFAAELLMPAKFLERDLKGKDIDLLEEGQLNYLIRGFLSQILVSDIMNQKFYSVSRDETIENASVLMVKKKVNHLPVVSEDGKLEGIVTSWDITKAVACKITELDEIITRDVKYVREGEKIETASSIMEKHSISALPVLDSENRIIGMVTSESISALIGRFS